MANTGTSIIAIFLAVDFILAFGGFVPLDNSFSSGFVDIDMDAGTANATGNASSNMGLDYDVSGITTNPFSTISLLSIVWDFILTVGTFVFAPITALLALGAPFPIVLVLGVIPSMLFIVAVVSFIWRKDF